MTTRSIALVLCLSLAWLAPPAAAQEERELPDAIGGLSFSDQYEVTVVNIDVYVRDKQGNPVTDLDVDDFRVWQDGEPRAVSNFELYTEEVYRQRYEPPMPMLPGPETADAAEAADGAAGEDEADLRPISVILYVDNENLRPFDRNRVLSQVRGWVSTTLRPPMRMSVISYQRSLETVQEFTSEPGEILAALKELRTYTGARTNRDAARRDVINRMQDILAETGSNVGGSRPNDPGAFHVYDLVRAFAEEESNDLQFTLGALRQTIASMAGLPGRKALVYVSSGLPLTPGRGLFHEYASSFQDNRMLSLISRYDRSRDFRSLASSANAQGVSFYTVDASGLQVDPSLGAQSRYAGSIGNFGVEQANYQDTLLMLADLTGGQAIINTNDVSAGLGRIRQDLYTYYSLGYTLASAGADRIHRIRIELPDHPEYEVRYRRRFVEKGIESRVQDRVMTNLVYPTEHNPMELELRTGRPAPASGDRWLLPASVVFPVSSVALLPEGDDYVGRVTLFVAARDEDGKQSDLTRQQHEIRVPADRLDAATAERWTIDVQLLMEPGSYVVSVGLLDLVTRQSSYAIGRQRLADPS